MKKLLKLSGNIVTTLLVIFIILSMFSMVRSKLYPEESTSVMGFKFMSVLTGSMSPALEAGDMLVARKAEAEKLKVNDVITYKTEDGTLITHRIMEIVDRDGALRFITKGDANNVEDRKPVEAYQLVGEYVFRIPHGGYIANFARSKLGLFVFILIPAVLLISGEVKTILSEIGKKKDYSPAKDNADL